MQSFTPVGKEQLTRCRPSFANVFFLCCRIMNIELLFCPRTPVLSVIVSEELKCLKNSASMLFENANVDQKPRSWTS